MIDDLTRKQLDSEDWDSIVPALTDYAMMKVNKAFWRGGRGHLPGAGDIEDLVFGAVEATYCGERKWNPQKEPDLLRFLKGVVDSEVNHLMQSYEHRHREYGATRVAAPHDVEEPVNVDPADPGQDPLSETIANDIWRHLWKSTEGDDDVQLVLMCIEDGVVARSDLATRLEWNLARVDNTLKRFRRNIKKCIGE